MEFFIGQIYMVGFNFAPRSSALCNGQLLAISQNSALFSLLGTTFGGDGRTTFGLPDLRGRTALHVGSGPGLQNVTWGQRGGVENTQLTVANMPAHGHNLAVGQTGRGSGYSSDPTNAYPAELDSGITGWSTSPSQAFTASTTSQGSNQAFTNRSPYLGIYHCIALQGIFPSRN